MVKMADQHAHDSLEIVRFLLYLHITVVRRDDHAGLRNIKHCQGKNPAFPLLKSIVFLFNCPGLYVGAHIRRDSKSLFCHSVGGLFHFFLLSFLRTIPPLTHVRNAPHLQWNWMEWNGLMEKRDYQTSVYASCSLRSIYHSVQPCFICI